MNINQTLLNWIFHPIMYLDTNKNQFLYSPCFSIRLTLVCLYELDMSY